MGKKWLTVGEGPPEGCGHRKRSEAVVNLQPSKEGFGIVGWRVIHSIFLSSHLLIFCWCLLLPRPM